MDHETRTAGEPVAATRPAEVTVPATPDVTVPTQVATAVADRHAAGGRPRGADRLPPQTLLRLQRTHGNAAVCQLVGPAARATPTVTASAQVQRCGGEVHDGCSCAEDTEEPALDPGATVADQAANGPGATSVQRDGPTPAADADKTAIPADSPWARTPPRLMTVLTASYRNNTMMFAHGPDETLVQVLDRVGLSVISIASEIYERMQARGIWGFVKDITWVWLTTSRGLTFNTTGGLRGAVNSNPGFCKEFLVASMAYHGTTDMWRELVTTGTPGLHIGAAEEPASVHIDMHQVALPPPLFNTGYCAYDPIALVGHWGDLQGNDSTVFSRADSDRSRMDAEARTISAGRTTAPNRAGDLDALNARLTLAQARMNGILPRLRMLATAGMEGEQEATKTDGAEVDAIDTEVTAIHDAVSAILNPAPPVESTDGGVGADDEE